MMKYLVVVISMFLTACSSKTQVHLFAKHLSPEQVSELVNKIDSSQFAVDINYHAFPADIGSNALVYAPSQNSRPRLNALMKSLASAGFPIANTNLLIANNHSFTENNVGVYLLPDGVKIKHDQTVNLAVLLPTVNEYGALDCFDATTLFLKADQAFEIEINRWHEDVQDHSQIYHHGRWSLIDGTTLMLSSSQWPKDLLFARSEFERQEINGVSKGIMFSPISKVDKTSPNSAVNCRYSISLALE